MGLVKDKKGVGLRIESNRRGQQSQLTSATKAMDGRVEGNGFLCRSQSILNSSEQRQKQ